MKYAVFAALTLSALTAGDAPAQSLDIRWFTIDAGGGTLGSGSYSLTGTIGQHDVGPPLAAGSFTLIGGFFAAPLTRCAADWTGDGSVNSADFFAFLSDFFGGDADLNGDGQTTSQDFFDYLTAFFSGC